MGGGACLLPLPEETFADCASGLVCVVIHFGRWLRGGVGMPGCQMSLVEALLDPRLGANARLEAIAGVIDWAPVERLAGAVHPGERGRPPYAPGPMVRALWLKALYGLSDPGLEEALADRLSFRRFCGFDLCGPTPDHATLFRFGAAAAGLGVLQACFDEVLRQLDAKGLVLRQGTMVDATIVAAASRKPGIKAGARVAREPGAAWTRKGGRSHFGYRLHVGVDRGSGLVRRLRFTPANVGESPVADSLVCGDERAVYGDKGYENKARRKRLRAQGVKDRICHRGHKHQNGLPFWQGRRNAGIARRRAPVEAVFGTMKRVLGYTRARSAGFVTNLGHALCCATVCNLRRAVSLTAQARAAPPVAA